MAAIISSGDEIVHPGVTLQSGQVRDINSYSLSSLVAEAGGLGLPMGIVSDEREELHELTIRALEESDFVIITAGSSASTRDLTASVIHDIGVPGVLVHGINIRPGKPTILGVCDGKAVVGLPGNPVSALVIAGIFIVPIIHHLLGIHRPVVKGSISARLTLNLSSRAGREDYVPVRLIQGQDGWQADPIFYKSNLIFSLVKADGLIRIPPQANGLPAGGSVEVLML